MKKNVILLILLFTLFTLITNLNCKQGKTTELNSEMRGLSSGSIKHDDLERTFFVYIPSSYDENSQTPMVIAIHGGGGTAYQMPGFTGFNELAEKEGFIVLYPQGIEKQWNDGRPLKTRAFEENIDDVGFISNLIDHVSKIFNINEKRIYATGISNGGFMSFRLAYFLSDKIAAVAPVTATVSEALYNDFTPLENQISLLIMNGTEDPLVPYEGGEVSIYKVKRGKILSTDDTVDFWVNHNNCLPDPEITEIPDKDVNDGTTVEEIKYKNNDGTEVILYKIEGGGHTWPGGSQYLPIIIIGKVCKDIDGAEEIWKFFKRHQLD